MSNVEEKLRRGFGLIERSSSDSDLLGVALIAIHSALEDYLRGELSNNPGVSAEERQRLIRREIGWLPLVELAQRQLGLSEEQRRIILSANEIRQSFAHGNPFRWRVGDVLRYGRFVEQLCDAQGLFEEVLLERRKERASRPLPQAEPEPSRSGVTLLRLAIIAVVLVAIVYGAKLAYDQARAFLELNSAPPPAVTSTPALPLPSPTAATRQARIVNLGGGPGWLHETPSFTSPTLPIRLSEGDLVVVLDRDPVEAEGATWQYVEAGGYQGWSPVNNMELTP